MASQNPWEISPAEYQANMAQFASLNPLNGKIDGNAARSILIKSNLPAPTLSQIWQLSDLDKDGYLDLREFSIAMRLAKNCLAGIPLPPVLPPSLTMIPGMGNGVPSMMPSYAPPVANQFPVYNTAPAGFPGGIRPTVAPGIPPRSTPPTPGATPQRFPGKEIGNWSIPHQARLKYCQQFNQLDKQRLGFLSGQAGRSALGLSGMPTPALAHIWTLSDVNKDGRLSVDEFCVAMHLIDMHKAGYALPDQTPPELAQMCGVSRSANNSPQLEPGAPPPQKSPAAKTFEDKRMDNFAKGQAELERRRQILMEEENRRKAEIEKKEREEFERRERERLEKERQREMERAAEMERQRILEEARQEEMKKKQEELDAQRREHAKVRLAEMEKQRVKEMQTQKQHEAEKTAQKQQRQKVITFQLQALDEKAADTETEIGKARERIAEITKEIEGMRSVRDEKMKKIGELQKANQALSVQSQELAHQLLQMQSANKETASRKQELETLQKRRDAAKLAVAELNKQLTEATEKVAKTIESVSGKKEGHQKTRQTLLSKREEYRKALELFGEIQKKAREKLAAKDAAAAAALEAERQRQAAEEEARRRAEEEQRRAQMIAAASQQAQAQAASGSSASLPASSSSGGSSTTTKYRAVFPFTARSEDELSFEPGDIILVFEGHAAEPGWRAGQIKEKVGWFPEAFAEPLAPVVSATSEPLQNMPPNVTPSPSLDRIPEDAALKSVGARSDSIASNSNVLCECVALFPWKARNDGDLSFAKGDIIEILEKTDVKWKGRRQVDGQIGYFPKSYVKLKGEGSQTGSTRASLDMQTPTNTPTTGVPKGQNGIGSKQQSVTSPNGAAAPFGVSQSQQSLSKLPASNSGEWFIAVYEFEATEPTDLGLKVGDRVLVTKQEGDWWKGRLGNKEGDFPANYVQKIETQAAPPTVSISSRGAILGQFKAIASFDASAGNQMTLRTGDIVSVREKSEAGWWEGETVRNGQPVAGWFPGSHVKAIEGPNTTSPGAVTAVASFDYDASQPDELSFKIGDVIVIDDKTDTDWWTGHKASAPHHKGLFPSNHVQLSHPPFDVSAAAAAPRSLTRQPRTSNWLYDVPPTELTQVAPAPAKLSNLYDLPPEPTPRSSTSHNNSSELYDVPPPINGIKNSNSGPVAKPRALYDAPPGDKDTAADGKREKLIEELASTEEKYLTDLIIAKKLYYNTLLKYVQPEELKRVFLNWDALIDVAKRMVLRMRNSDSPGSIFLSEIDNLSAFVTFCSQQQSALDALGEILKVPEVSAAYTKCCTDARARGMSLNYFILLPLGRVTRYPLLIEKMLANCDPGSTLHSELDTALQLLKALVAEVNQAVSEVDNVAMLGWAQYHCKCHGISPPIEFTSPTKYMGHRTFIHSGILYKAKSNRILVGLLFNDMLLLTTPDENINSPEKFKLSKTSEGTFTLYKQPYLLSSMQVEVMSEDVTGLILKCGALPGNRPGSAQRDAIFLRCVSSNARRLWLNQLETSIDIARVAVAEQLNKSSHRLSNSQGKGRLVVELIGFQNLNTKALTNSPHNIKLSLGESIDVYDVDLAKPDACKIGTQFQIASKNDVFRMGIYQTRYFSQDQLLLEELIVPLNDVINETSRHRGAILKTLPLKKDSKKSASKSGPQETVTLKFVVQSFDPDL